MNIVLVIVMSADGNCTKWDDPNIYSWTSKEDQEQFFKLRDQSKVLIMGRKTFESAQSLMKHSPDKLRVVMTHRPDKYHNLAIPNQLEFVDSTATELVKVLTSRGHNQALLVGGQEINNAFLKEKLVSEVWLTIEPQMFGYGTSPAAVQKLSVELQLESIEKLNQKGTVLLKYTVV